MKSVLRKILLVVVVIVLLMAIVPAIHYYKYFTSHVSTDDAYVDGSVALISARIPGTVGRLYVMENWHVNAGDPLLELDPRDYKVRLDQAQAQLERARQSVDQSFAQLEAAQAGAGLAGSQLNQAKIDFERARELRKEGVVSREFYDQADTAMRVALADQALAEHQVQQARAALGGESHAGVDHTTYNRPIVQQAQAALEGAKLDLSYTLLRAPLTGIITRKSVHVGNRIQPGEPLMALVPTDRLYITANFKETQLTQVRVGQPADLEADIYPGFIYKAHIDSISVGTGAAFALLPPENATGNWVKVVQRVPVKIVLNQPAPADKPLRMGLSVEVTVDISDTSGPLLTSTLQNQYQHGNVQLEGAPPLTQPPASPGDVLLRPANPSQPEMQH
ncbi:MAG TPA: HlyD family secretion protein [Candidatus Binataceae bacterium]|jgi:membrane fusion protein, multidrug efflux system|nr:HlyD family secretion protein [Candidatus Binataceae bacterium]